MFKKKEKPQINTFNQFSLKDDLASSYIREEEDFLKVGETYETTLIAINYRNQGKLGWLRKLYNMRGNISITMHLTPTDSGSAVNNIDRALRNARLKIAEQRLSDSEKRAIEKNISKLETSLDNLLEDENNGFFRFGLSVKLRAESKEELDKLERQVKNKLISCKVSVMKPHGSMLDSFRTDLPFIHDCLARYTAREMDAQAIATMLPMDSQNLNISDGFVVGFDPKTGQLINIHPRSLHNHNGVIFGESGQGKSSVMWQQMSRFSKEEKRVIVLDPEDEYSYACKNYGGTTINVSNGTSDVINPFQVFYENTKNALNDYDLEEQDEDVTSFDVFSQHLLRLQEFFSLLVPDASEVILSYVDDFLTKLYENFNIGSETDFSLLKPTDYPILEDLYFLMDAELSKDAFLKDKLNDFMIVLKKYVSGANKRIFNGHTNVDLNNNFVVFNIKELGTGTPMQIAAMSNVINYIWNLITNDIKETYLFIDELHVLNDPRSTLTMKLVRDIYKRIRKYGHSGVWSATQQTGDTLKVSVDGVNYGSAVVANSAIKLLLPLDGMSIQVLKDEVNMSFSKEEERILKPRRNKRGEGLMIYGSEKAHVQFELMRSEWEALGKKPYEKAA